MKCQHCGNELVPDEVFCGQCGNPNATPIQPTEMIQAPSSKNGLWSSGNRIDNMSPNQSGLNPSAIRPNQNFQQQGGFYQDATEAVSMAPGTQYPQQAQGGPGMSSGYQNVGQFGAQAQQQPFSTGAYPPNMTYPPAGMGFTTGQFGQGYGARAGAPPRRNNALLIVGIVCLILAIITVGAVGTLFVLKGGNNNQAVPTTIVQATATVAPTPSPTPSPTPTPSPIPSPTAVPTPTPDANFSWCDTPCTQGGYQIEFPNGWAQSASQSGPGIQFTNVGGADVIYAAVKTPSTNATSASDLLTADEANFSNQPGYQGPQSAPSVTIGGENWNAEVLYYQLNGQTEEVNIYATIHQGKGYVIELQAAQAQFSTIMTQYFSLMITSFQFVAATT